MFFTLLNDLESISENQKEKEKSKHKSQTKHQSHLLLKNRKRVSHAIGKLLHLCFSGFHLGLFIVPWLH